MTTGQYAAISTMAAMQAAHTAISNNLANVGTPGYKQDIPQTEQFNDIFVTLLDVNLGLGNVDTTTEIVGATGGGTQLLPLLLDLTPGLFACDRTAARPRPGGGRVLDRRHRRWITGLHTWRQSATQR